MKSRHYDGPDIKFTNFFRVTFHSIYYPCNTSSSIKIIFLTVTRFYTILVLFVSKFNPYFGVISTYHYKYFSPLLPEDEVTSKPQQINRNCAIWFSLSNLKLLKRIKYMTESTIKFPLFKKKFIL